jgi:hypothetical protein
MIHDNPTLFKIVCNINIGRFVQLLEDHPNQAFVQSVVMGLCEGFWRERSHKTDTPSLTMNLNIR